MASQKPTIGFVGLGLMGFGMATHLVKQGYTVKGFDISADSLKRFKEAGGIPCTSLAESAKDVAYYICMVASAPQAQSVLFDHDEAIIKYLQKDATFLLCSTVPATYAQSAASQLSALKRDDIYFIDCPVSGGTFRAADGTLSIMAAAPEPALDKASFLLKELSHPDKLFIVPGGIGQGSNLKMVHQVLAAIHILASSEAMGLAARLGLDAKKVREEVVAGDAWGWMYENRTPRMLQEDYFPGASAVTIILKDVGIITDAARDAAFATPLSSTSEQVYLSALSNGWGAHDDAGMVRFYYPDGPITKVIPQPLTQDASSSSKPSGIALITTLLKSIYLLSAAESIAFAHHVGLDLDQYFTLCCDAAGGSVMYRTVGPQMIAALKGGQAASKIGGTEKKEDSIDGIAEGLREVVKEAQRVRCPLYLGTATLNLLELARRRVGGGRPGAGVIGLWVE